jgi:peptidoglycan/xylan/chitin deacetylase (PgdA/CDA1 family)
LFIGCPTFWFLALYSDLWPGKDGRTGYKESSIPILLTICLNLKLNLEVSQVINNFLFYTIISLVFFNSDVSIGMDEFKPKLAKWYKNKRVAVSLRFDDSYESHIKIAIPALNQYDFKATFMVNPGKSRYLEHQEFWELKVPAMGHRFGNHTMHHKGADTLKEADYEIGEVSRLIWRLFPNKSKLNVFASGGGGLMWGGEYWPDATDDYKKLLRKYHLIDLYDGNYPSKSVNSIDTADDLCKQVNTALTSGSYKAFHFHDIGKRSVREKSRKIVIGKSLTVKANTFRSFLKCLNNYKDSMWIAPVISIFKYETEYNSSNLTVYNQTKDSMQLKLNINTDIILYDQKLTLIIPANNQKRVNSIMQNNKVLDNYYDVKSNVNLVDVEPIESRIVVNY